MRGHIRKRGATWTYVIEIGRHPATGRRRQKWRSGFRTRREAQRALAEDLARINRGAYVEASRLTVAAFLRDEWLPSVATAVRPSTHASYRMIVETHLVPGIGAKADPSPHRTGPEPALYGAADERAPGRTPAGGPLGPSCSRDHPARAAAGSRLGAPEPERRPAREPAVSCC